MGTLTDQGYVADKLDDIFSGLVTKFKGIYGDDILTDSDDPDGQMIGIFAQMRADIEGVIASVVQANDPDNATGTWLEQKVAFAGLERRGASYSVIEDMLIEGQTSSPVKAGFTVSGGGTQWVTLTDTVIGEDGTIKADFQAVDTGQFSVDAGVSMTIVTVIAGVTKVTTTVAATPGENEETDPELLARFYKSRARAAKNCVDATLADIAGLVGVTDAIALENQGDETDARGVAAHSVNYIVEGGDNAAIAKVIYDNWPGTGLQGAVSVDVTRYSGKTVPISFDRPEPVDISADIKIGRRENFTHIDEDTVKAAIVALIFKTGAWVYKSDVVQAANSISGVFVREVLLARDDDTPIDTLSVAIGAREKARFITDNISITVVEAQSS